ncbi:hypothetical protein H6P81_010680 [Aristolochia fimbriata]|uniref:Uncharacterized protein n=1 Tax=Aristolochia fimbriata TaxID=158543 RepID=A0AAV7ERJ4_ARIFI|nr:hypothetical protein H6P81_010680 [Aristolochia fimbriata]
MTFGSAKASAPYCPPVSKKGCKRAVTPCTLLAQLQHMGSVAVPRLEGNPRRKQKKPTILYVEIPAHRSSFCPGMSPGWGSI